jgi:predicted DNA binding CopG/RHH family protein
MATEWKLDKEERELLNSYERGEWRSVDQLRDRLQQYQTYAMATLEAAGLITIALPQEDLQVIRRKAQEAGMSSQRLIAEILHRFVLGQLDY